MSDWQVLGPHHYRLEDDILNWRPAGEVLPEHVRGVCELFDGIVARHGHVLWLVDARHSVAVGPESRRLYGAWIKQQARSNLVVAAYGVPLAARTTAMLILRGVQMQGIEVAHQRFDDEAAARVYLDEWRAAQGGRRSS